MLKSNNFILRHHVILATNYTASLSNRALIRNNDIRNNSCYIAKLELTLYPYLYTYNYLYSHYIMYECML